MSMCLAPARAAASRINGARSRGPKTSEGKERAAQNALKHGLRAEKFVVVRGEHAEQFRALEAALVDELAPAGALQSLLTARIARAAWRLERAERIEAELFERHGYDAASLGLAMIRDGNNSRAFDTLLRYRGAALAELWRALRLLKALQAEQAHQAGKTPPPADAAAPERPIEPESRRSPGDIPPLPADAPGAAAAAGPGAVQPGSGAGPACLGSLRREPNEPEARRNPGTIPAMGPHEDGMAAWGAPPAPR
jgi:hypothetical protein